MPTEILHATAQSLRRMADLVSEPLALDSFDTAAKTIRQATIDAAKLVAQAVIAGGLPFLREEGNVWPIKSLLEERPTPFNSEDRDERWSMVWEMLPNYIRRYVPAGVVAHTRGLEGWKTLSVFPGGSLAVAEQPKTLSELRRRAAVEAQLMRTLADLIDGAPKHGGAEPMPETTAATKPKLGKEAIAVATLVDHPEWTNQQVADEVGCHVKTLSGKEWKKFRAARAVLADGRSKLPNGSKDKETGDVEAWNDEG
jgi:hypothetical protein